VLALWRSPLAGGDVVTLAEPLAYVPILSVMISGQSLAINRSKICSSRP